MNRQYIGARYVPKFYEGSNGSNWESNHSYEALTIVTYLNNSYTSKIPVPATAGNPADNPGYWVLTGNFNAQVEEYRKDVEILSNRKYIFIGDSYGETRDGTSWIDELVSSLGLTNGMYYKTFAGGYGFHPAYTGGDNAKFILLLQALSSVIYNKDEITDIVVGGGFNDRGQTIANIKTAISEFCTYAKANYINARIWIAGFGWSFNAEFVQELNYGKYLEAYKECGEYGAIYITGSDWIMHNRNLYEAENQSPYTLHLGNLLVHPNATGSKLIASCLAGALLGGNSCAIHSEKKLVNFTLSSDVTISGNCDIAEYQQDGNIVFEMAQTVFHIPATAFYFDRTAVELGTLNDGSIAGGTGRGFIGQTYGFAVGTDNQNHSCCFNLYVRGNRLYCYALLDNITATDLVICPFQSTTVTTEC